MEVGSRNDFLSRFGGSRQNLLGPHRVGVSILPLDLVLPFDLEQLTGQSSLSE
jgi:hypothetical protein